MMYSLWDGASTTLKGTKGVGALLTGAPRFGEATEGVDAPSVEASYFLAFSLLLGVEGKAERRRGVPFMAFSAR